MMDALSQEQMEWFCASLWALWSERNKLLWLGTSFNPSFLFVWVGQYVSEFQLARFPVKDTQKQKRHLAKWEYPPRGRLKMNIDGAYCSEKVCGGIVVIVRDEKGLGDQAVAKRFEHAHSVLHMELEACKTSLQLGISHR